MRPRSIFSINNLSMEEKIEIYSRFIPTLILERFKIPETFIDPGGNHLLQLRAKPGTIDVEIELKHTHEALDPLLYAHLTDTVNGQIHVLLYIVNDPTSPRYDVDRMPDGTKTQFGIFKRNFEEEERAMLAGLAPGQVRAGMRILNQSIVSFETFVQSLDHDLFFVEPLYYHNAIIFEKYGFAYLRGRRLMDRIHQGFQKNADLWKKLDQSTPFRLPQMADSIRGRSWAIHDGVLDTAFDNVTMYKSITRHAGINTFPNSTW